MNGFLGAMLADPRPPMPVPSSLAIHRIEGEENGCQLTSVASAPAFPPGSKPRLAQREHLMTQVAVDLPAYS